METVKKAWEAHVTGQSALNILHHKLCNTSKALNNWSKQLFNNAKLQLQIAEEVIHHLDKAQEDRLLTLDEIELHKQLKIRALGLAALERSRHRQCSRITWLRDGDACTRFLSLESKCKTTQKMDTLPQEVDRGIYMGS